MAARPKAPSKKKITSKSRPSPAKSKSEHTTEIDGKIANVRDFIVDDYQKTLFPLMTNRYLIEHGEKNIVDYIGKCISNKHPSYSFAPQIRVYASKPGGYLRRTVKLDAVAEYYIYQLVYNNRKLFRKPHSTVRSHYGYRFESNVPIAATQAYKGFKGALSEHGKAYSASLGLDIATYFNNLYHHDLVNWFRELGASEEDSGGLGQLLREIAAGRSIDCLPQGLYPTKMIGNDFLRFVDNFHGLKCNQLVRFMDDIYLFSNDKRAIDSDFQTIQRLLGGKGLSINPRKTIRDEASKAGIDDEINSVKRRLLKRRRIVITTGYDTDGAEIQESTIVKMPLDSKEASYLDFILEKEDIEEEDAELLLTIMRGHASKVEKRLPYIMEKYPHLAKNVYNFCFGTMDKAEVARAILSHAKEHDDISENQLFWFCATLSDQLMNTDQTSNLISVLFNHKSATNITRAKILEIPDTRFGLQDLRGEYLSAGNSDWLGWSSAVGSRALKPGSRNHALKYFGRASNFNHLVATIISTASDK